MIIFYSSKFIYFSFVIIISFAQIWSFPNSFKTFIFVSFMVLPESK